MNNMYLIIGWGRTGKAAYDFLKNRSINSYIFDDHWIPQEHIDGTNNYENIPWEKITKAILSPGVATWKINPPVVSVCRQKGIPVFSDLDILYHFNSDKNFIGITGSQGKTTIHDFLTKFMQNKYSLSSGGNNGIPCLSLPTNYYFCLEVSMQLLFISQSIFYNIGIFSNFFDTHQEMGDFNFRLNAKRKILTRSKLLNQRFIIGDFPRGTIKLLGTAVDPYDIGVFSSNYHTLDDIHTSNYVFVKELNNFHKIFYKIDNHYGEFLLDNGLGFKLLAIENIGIVWAFLILINHTNTEEFKHLLTNYELVDHRLTCFKTMNNLKFLNGSKCTNSFAFKSLLSYVNYFYHGKNYWIIGGVLNSPVEDFYNIAMVNDSVYVYGVDGNNIYQFLKDKLPEIYLFHTLEEVVLAIKNNLVGNIQPVNVLLTPGCQSFDQFKDFEDRGMKFVKLINDYFNL